MTSLAVDGNLHDAIATPDEDLLNAHEDLHEEITFCVIFEKVVDGRKLSGTEVLIKTRTRSTWLVRAGILVRSLEALEQLMDAAAEARAQEGPATILFREGELNILEAEFKIRPEEKSGWPKYNYAIGAIGDSTEDDLEIDASICARVLGPDNKGYEVFATKVSLCPTRLEFPAEIEKFKFNKSRRGKNLGNSCRIRVGDKEILRVAPYTVWV